MKNTEKNRLKKVKTLDGFLGLLHIIRNVKNADEDSRI